ncbi:hypothetical protein BDV95DRAFT_589458 [Massariosphaeria phaeospora]|uniref:Uncharacterized protein n=1 Tax=Massariosphaeria phaeospora TaxID=100035 RepID=A0A7C8MIW2_9PLEO|nr:hypothetical protein BDV95DRAFT_589458 [Massariosphaeria phaeospora]
MAWVALCNGIIIHSLSADSSARRVSHLTLFTIMNRALDLHSIVTTPTVDPRACLRNSFDTRTGHSSTRPLYVSWLTTNLIMDNTNIEAAREGMGDETVEEKNLSNPADSEVLPKLPDSAPNSPREASVHDTAGIAESPEPESSPFDHGSPGKPNSTDSGAEADASSGGSGPVASNEGGSPDAYDASSGDSGPVASSEEDSPNAYDATAHNPSPSILPNPDPTQAIPDIARAKMTEIPELRQVWDAYAQGYTQPDEDAAAHMTRAKAFAEMLLAHIYPAEQGFSVAPWQWATSGNRGWHILQKPEIETKGSGKNKKQVVLFERDPVFIPPASIAGYIVHKDYTLFNADNTTYPARRVHTFLGILIDDLATFEHWAPESDQPAARPELMNWSLGWHAEIADGTAMLLVGPRIELYGFRYDRDRQPMRHYASNNWAFDLREDAMATVRITLEAFCMEAVQYLDGFVGIGTLVPKADGSGLKNVGPGGEIMTRFGEIEAEYED